MEGERQPAPEIAPAPTSEAPAAAAIGPALGAGMGPAVNGLTTPAAVLALQRSAGNAAVTRALLARDEAEKTKVSGPGDFTATGGEPKGEGVTTAGKDPGDATKAKAVAPKVTMPATVKLNPGKTIGNETGQLGHIQNLTTSTCLLYTSPSPRDS